MRIKRKAPALAASLMSLIFVALSASSANSASAKMVEGEGYVIVYPQDALQSAQGTFFPTGDIDEDTVVVIAESDGSLPGGITERQLAEMIAARSAATAERLGLGVTGAWSREASNGGPTVTPSGAHSYTAGYTWTGPFSGSNIWGWDDTAKVGYTFNVTEGSNQKAGGQGLGHYRGYNGSEFGVWQNWYGLGVASSNSNGGATVPWGSVLATAKFKAISLAKPHIATGSFAP